jgi:hypothetical protein
MANLHNLQAVVGVSGTKADVEALSATLTEIKFAYATDSGEIGVYSGGAWHWTAAAIALDDLTDVTITSAAGGEILQYSGAAWVNAPAPAGEVLMADGEATITPLTNEDETDWLYGG